MPQLGSQLILKYGKILPKNMSFLIFFWTPCEGNMIIKCCQACKVYHGKKCFAKIMILMPQLGSPLTLKYDEILPKNMSFLEYFLDTL